MYFVALGTRKDGQLLKWSEGSELSQKTKEEQSYECKDEQLIEFPSFLKKLTVSNMCHLGTACMVRFQCGTRFSEQFTSLTNVQKICFLEYVGCCMII
jgi:hypothetical protein